MKSLKNCASGRLFGNDYRKDRLIFLALGFIGGCIFYFSLPTSRGTLVWAMMILLLSALFILIVTRLNSLGAIVAILRIALPGVMILLATSGGYLASAWRTEALGTRFIYPNEWHGRITGYVEEVGLKLSGRQRVIIKVGDWGNPPAIKPQRVQLSLRKGERIFPGDRLSLTVKLFRPSGPMAPGSYDFAFYSYFNQIGAVGYGLSKVKKLSVEGGVNRPDMAIWVENIRAAIRMRFGHFFDQPALGVAAALSIGERGEIVKSVYRDMQNSGLAHILAISGLHVGIAAGGMFWFVRAVLALVPGLALRFALHKWSAFVGIITALAVLLLSGGSPATERAFVMSFVMFGAIILDKRAFTLRNVAIALMGLLLFRPEYCLYPGFQMSFGAVAALITFAQSITINQNSSGFKFSNHRDSKLVDQRATGLLIWPTAGGLIIGDSVKTIVRYLVVFLLGTAATSLIAGLSTAPFIAFHFHRLATYGILANMLAIPIVVFLTVPFMVISLLTMMVGLEYLPLMVVNHSIGWIINIAGWVSSLPGAIYWITPLKPFTIILAFGGLSVLCLATGLKRWLGLIGLLAFFLPITHQPVPNVIISQNRQLVGVRVGANEFALLGAKRNQFVAAIWNGMYHFTTVDNSRANRSFNCRGNICRIIGDGGVRVAVLRSNDKKTGILPNMQQLCLNNQLIIAPDHSLLDFESCQKALVITSRRLASGGAQAITISADGKFRLISALNPNQTGARPWHPVRVNRLDSPPGVEP